MCVVWYGIEPLVMAIVVKYIIAGLPFLLLLLFFFCVCTFANARSHLYIKLGGLLMVRKEAIKCSFVSLFCSFLNYALDI